MDQIDLDRLIVRAFTGTSDGRELLAMLKNLTQLTIVAILDRSTFLCRRRRTRACYFIRDVTKLQQS